MIQKTMRRRMAVLTSGAVAALGLVVVPAVAGLSPASATITKKSIPYACKYQAFDLPATLDITVATPDAAAVGEAVNPAVTATLKWSDAALTTMRMAKIAPQNDSIVFTVATTTGSTPGSLAIAMPGAAIADSGPVAWPGTGTWGTIDTSAEGNVPLSVGAGTLTGKITVFGAPELRDLVVPCAATDTKIGDLPVGDAPDPDPVAVPVDGAVKITGTPKVGKTLKAVPGATEDATVTYQWLSNGKAIKGATKSSLKLSKTLRGKKVSVKATYSKDGFLPVTQTSKAVTVKK